MIRLNLIVEGQTEEAFVNELLLNHLGHFGVVTVPRCVETRRDKRRHRIFRGGATSYQRFKKDILRWIKEDRNADARFSMMFDLYALPDDFPSYADSQKIADCYERVGLLESALERDISDPRLIPYIQMHEFEALLFSDPSKFLHQYPGRTNAIKELERIVTATGNPELINDGETTSPSKRIIALIPEYEFRKSSDGPIISSHIGLEVMREKCHHFNEWLTRIEKLSAISPPK